MSLSRPLPPAAAAFALGVASASILGMTDATRIASCAWIAAAFLLAGLALAFARNRRLAAFALLLGAFFVAGVAIESLRRQPEETLTRVLGEITRDAVLIEGVVRDAPEADGDRAKIILEASAVAKGVGATLERARGTLALFIDGRSCGDAGDRIRVLAQLRVPEEAAFPGDVSARALAERQGVALFAYARPRDPCVLLRAKEQSGLRVRMERYRSSVHAAIDRHLPADEAAIVRAFATGDRARIKKSVTADFAASGLSHLLAVSGLNLAIVAGIFVVALVMLFKAIPRVALSIGARRLAAVAALPFVALYTMLVGASPSSVRAALMIASLLASYVLLRSRETWSALSLAVIAMLAWDPGVIEDVSFQLSFAAVASLLLLYPAMRSRFSAAIHRLPRLVRWTADVAIASASATLGTLPLVAWHFQRISIVGLAANVPAAPLSSIILVPLSLLGGLLGTLSDTLAHPVLAIAGFSSRGLVDLAHAASVVPAGSFRIFAPTALECGLLSVGTVLTVISSRRSLALRIGIVCLAALAVELGASAAFRRFDPKLRAAILPVGQGDGIVLELPHGRVIAIDTGPPAASPDGRSAAERVILPYLRHRRIGAIDRLILTHPHADHTGGLAALAAEVTVREIWWTNDQREGPPDLRSALLATGARLRVVTATLAPETIDGVTLEVEGPIGRAAEHPIVNDGSIVVRIRYGSRALLFTGDAETASETAMVTACAACLRADVLKAGHHGSKTSTGEAFLAAVDPAHAIISDGRLNRFGFPHRAVLERLDGRGTTIWRTDQDGAIFVETDGRDLRVRSFRQKR